MRRFSSLAYYKIKYLPIDALIMNHYALSPSCLSIGYSFPRLKKADLFPRPELEDIGIEKYIYGLKLSIKYSSPGSLWF